MKRERDALQFRQFIWRAMREMEHDEELRRKGGRKRRGAHPKNNVWSLQLLHQTQDIKVT